MNSKLPMLLQPLAAVIIALLFAVARPALAQDATPSATLPPEAPLALNETLTAQLTNDEAITYVVDLDAGQDTVIALDAQNFVNIGICLYASASPDAPVSCQGAGGGGADGPVSYTYLVPAPVSPGMGDRVQITIGRFLEGTARYSLTAHTVTPQRIALGETLTVETDATQPYQVYTLESDAAQPFALEIEDVDTMGNFLWVAHQPYLPTAPDIAPARQPLTVPVDSAVIEDGEGIQALYLVALGGDAFRVIVRAEEAYALHQTPVVVTSLPPATTRVLSASYRVPLQVVRLDTRAGDVASVSVNLKAAARSSAFMAWTALMSKVSYWARPAPQEVAFRHRARLSAPSLPTPSCTSSCRFRLSSREAASSLMWSGNDSVATSTL